MAIVADEHAPTEQFDRRHAVVRHGSTRRVLTRLEEMVESGEVTPQAGDAGCAEFLESLQYILTTVWLTVLACCARSPKSPPVSP
jgi:hypothetical protein